MKEVSIEGESVPSTELKVKRLKLMSAVTNKRESVQCSLIYKLWPARQIYERHRACTQNQMLRILTDTLAASSR